jgi:perosamine synthetase
MNAEKKRSGAEAPRGKFRDIPAKKNKRACLLSSKPGFVPLSEPFISRNEEQAVLRCLRSGFVSSSGPIVGEFEQCFADAVGARYAVATSSGTAAIHVALKALNIAKDNFVFVPDLTFVASMNPVLYCGARPVLLDVEKTSWCLDPYILDLTCTEMTRNGRKPSAVIPVHLYGCACDMDAIMAIARKYNLHVIEDATEALGTRLNRKQVGTFGDMGCFSFNGNKLMTTGSGGMVVTDNAQLANRVRYLVNQARDSSDNYIHSEAGFNYRMNSVSASIGLAQLERLNDLLSRKREIALRYRKAFEDIHSIQHHPEGNDITSSFWLYSVVFERRKERDMMIQFLKNDGIQSRGFFSPLHTQPYVRDMVWRRSADGTSLSDRGISDHLSECGINLPSSAGLTRLEQERVISSFLCHLEKISLRDMNTSQKEIRMPKTA